MTRGTVAVTLFFVVAGCRSGDDPKDDRPRRERRSTSDDEGAPREKATEAADDASPSKGGEAAKPTATTKLRDTASLTPPEKRPRSRDDLLCENASRPAYADDPAFVRAEVDRCQPLWRALKKRAKEAGKVRGDQKLASAALEKELLALLAPKPDDVTAADYDYCKPLIEAVFVKTMADDPVETKVAWAKNQLGYIARSALGAFHREEAVGTSGALCKTATPVPEDGVPADGDLYTAKTIEFGGDKATGWACLRISELKPQPFRVGYTQGGPYKSAGYGGPDPGPDGAEVWAEGDLDGDGKTSLYWTVITKNGDDLKTSPQFCIDPRE